MVATDLLAMKIRWLRQGPGSWAASVNGVTCMLEMNDFPEEPMFTIRAAGSTAFIDDAPRAWSIEGLG